MAMVPAPEVVEELVLPPDRNCGFCLRHVTEMEAPRALPCNHVFCYVCVENKADNPAEQLDCPICKKQYIKLLVRKLRKVRISTDEETGEVTVTTLNPPCDACKNTLTDAVIYCMDCGKKMCEDHLESHKMYVDMQEEVHELIVMADYQLAPTKYIMKKCSQHTKYRLTEACEICFKTFCSRCTTREKCQKNDSKDHKVVSLSSLADKLRKEISEVNMRLYDKMKKCRGVEKAAWREFSDIEEHVEAMNKEVDRTAAELISEVQKQADAIKSKFGNYVEEMSGKVFDFSEDLLTKIAGLDSIFMAGQALSNKSPDTDVLENFHQITDKVREVTQDPSVEQGMELRRVNLHRGPQSIEIGLKCQPIPNGLKLLQSDKGKPDQHFCSVCWMDNSDEIMFSDGDCIHTRDSSFKELRSFEMPYTVHSMRSVDGIVVSRVGSSKDPFKLYMGGKESPADKFLCEVPYHLESFPVGQIDLSRNRIAAISSSDVVEIFNHAGVHLYDIPLKNMSHPCGLRIIEDEFVLVTDHTVKGELRKYRMEANSEPIWTHGGFLRPNSICYCHDKGLIFISSWKVISILTCEGKLVRELPIDGNGWDIAVRGSRIAMASFDGGIRLYDMIF